jgi:hypothetical protein
MATTRWTIGMSMAAALGLAALPARAGDDLNDAALRQQLVGQTIKWWTDGGFLHGALDLAADGRAAITMEPPVGADTGQWRINASQLCTTWQSARDGRELCYRVRQIDARRFVTTSGHVFELIGPMM